MNAEAAMRKFENLLDKVHPEALMSFLQLAKDRIEEVESEETENGDHNHDVILDNIRETLRMNLPLSAISNTETIVYPSFGSSCNVDPKNTLHVDAFLYDDALLDELVDEGKMSRNVCKSCGSHSVQPLTMITHSASVVQIKYIFCYLLPSLRDKTLLDIGSRTGAVLYGAYLYSKCSKIIGVEIDATFCKLQQQIITDYEFSDRIQVHHQDILDNMSLVSSSDVVILHNVFEFFMARELQVTVWRALTEALKKPGITVITVPSIEQSLKDLGAVNEVDMDWLKPVDTRKELEAAKEALLGDDDDNNELDSIYMYRT